MKCTKSLFMLHNETFNVWSHLVCGMYYLYQLAQIALYVGPYRDLIMRESLLIQTFACLACIFCMLSSSVYHLYNSLSREKYNQLLKLDLIGIGLKINGLALSLIYTGFHNYRGVGHPLSIVLALMMASNLSI